MEKPCENPILVSTGTSVGGKLHRIIITATFTITERMPGASAKAGQGGGKDRPEGVLRVTRARTYWAAHARAHGQACDCNSSTLQGDQIVTMVVVPPMGSSWCRLETRQILTGCTGIRAPRRMPYAIPGCQAGRRRVAARFPLHTVA